MDLTGTRVGKLLVLYRSGINKWGSYIWNCRCDCGNEVNVLAGCLRRKNATKSCGCLIGKIGHKIDDIKGQKFGKLTALQVVGRKKKFALWECRCDCGKIYHAISTQLRQGITKSCGCAVRRDKMQSVSTIMSRYQSSAKKRKREFLLTLDEFVLLTSSKCYYCGKAPCQPVDRRTKITCGYKYNGIDRVDNDKGYTKGNCVTCCGECNIAKGKLSQSAFLSLANRICEHQSTIPTKIRCPSFN